MDGMKAKQLEIRELKNRIKGCYTGKNIGGTFLLVKIRIVSVQACAAPLGFCLVKI